jgi:Zn-dependent protease
MLRFRIASIPVEVRPSHLLVAGLLAWSWMPSAQTRAPDAVPALLLGAMVVFVSILVHELGHAVAARAFGYQPQIVIEWFGGHTQPNAPVTISWIKEIVLTAAGPAFGFALGALAEVGLIATGGRQISDHPSAPLGIEVLGFFARANLVWALLNLVPVLPLDGGRISNTLATRIFGPRGVFVSQGFSLLICVAAVAFGVSIGQSVLAVFFAIWGVSAVQMIAAAIRGDGPKGGSAHPSEQALLQSAALFKQRRLAEAQRVATDALGGDPPPPPRIRTRLHHLLGWIAIKDGRGGDALNHFAQMDGQEVEPQAQAAAFTLSGDDERALPLWERAYQQTRDPTILHEWGGTFVRLGRAEDARRISGPDMRQALRAAERVLSIRGDHLGAARIGESTLAEFPAPELAYDTACSLAKAGRLDDAQAMLERAAELGFRDARFAQADADLSPLHTTPAFRDWLRRLQSARA